MYMILSKNSYKNAIIIFICQILYQYFILTPNKYLYDMGLIIVAKVSTKSIISSYLKL